MLARVIDWSLRNRFLVTLGTLAVVAGGILAVRETPLEALPDLSDVQVIVRTEYPGQAPQIVEDQVTFPVSSEMLKVPGAQTVRGYSFFGTSFVYVIFEDGTDLYWARSRVLEYLSAIEEQLPPAADVSLGPDATGLGWVYQYVVEDTTGRLSLAELRSFQDWVLRFQLTAIPGVAEVASVGGFEKTYEVTVDPVALQGFGIPVTRVAEALRGANQDVGATMLEMAEREFMIRGLGYLESLEDVEAVVVGATNHGTPIRVADVGNVREAPAVRRGVTDLNGRGDVVGGIVVMRYGENALATIERVKARLEEVKEGFPEGVVVKPVYDRSELIHRAVDTLKEKLLEESLVVALVCVLFLFHVRSAFVSLLVLPLGVLLAFIAMRWLGIGADIMSLGGIAIAVGAMIDASIVMVENLHKHLERALAEKGESAEEGVLRTDRLSTAERWEVVGRAAREVGPTLFFTLLIITVSFLPVFALEAQEGRLFRPLAWTKTLSMAGAALLSVTVVPVAMGLFIRGRIHREERNPLTRVLIALYRPVLTWALRNRILVVGASAAVVILSLAPLARIGSEFMPTLNEGTLLYMPTTLPGISVAAAAETLKRQGAILADFPEVESAFGKAGRANTATDPAPMSMFETTIVLKPESEWRPGMTWEALVDSMDRALRFAGVTNSWTMPIRGRIDMLATGIRTPVGAKLFGPDLAELERLAREVEVAVAMVPGTRSAYGERVMAGSYLDVEVDRDAAARYGISVETVQQVLASAVGGMEITRTVEGRERYAVRLRYPQELRDRPEAIARILVPVPGRRGEEMIGMASPAAMAGLPGLGGGMAGPEQIPLGQVATIRTTPGPMMVKTENAFPTAWVFVDVEGRDLGSYVEDARAMVASMVTIPPGYAMEWSGQYAFMERARARMTLVVPATLLLITVLLFLAFGTVGETLIVLISLPLALVGGVFLLWWLDFQWSVATAVGFIALAGVAAETGVIMLLYLKHAWEARTARGEHTREALDEAVMEGAVMRVRPKMMTVITVIAGLLPLFWGHGTGSEVMQRIAAPMVGGMVSALILTLVVIPVLYSLWHEAALKRVG
ncbi:MAG: CusA/CzcA family heavy metal efflux RND transporter [Longimicrobiales bacterium]|nr:CusA/CzcA family heavy metal efflux RND transporter [Longimicrobiales bacterium]